MILRPYQDECIRELNDAFRQGAQRLVLGSPTGSGKTIMASAMFAAVKRGGRRGLFIVDRIQLVSQAALRFLEAGFRVTCLQGDHPQYDPGPDIVVASIQTLRARWKALKTSPELDRLGLIVIDETHVLHKHHKTLLDSWNALPVVGLSATPLRKGLGDVYEKLIPGPSIAELTDQGYLVPVTAYGPSTPDLESVETRYTPHGKDWAEKGLSEVMRTPQIVADVVDSWVRLGEGRQTIAFAVDIAHSKDIAARFAEVGVTAEHMDAYTDAEKRQAILKRFRKKQTRIISSCNVLSVGFDEPAVQCVIMARPTQSLTVYIQQAGRGLRPDAGKTDVLVLDHAGNIARHGFPADFDLNGIDLCAKTAEWASLNAREKLPRPCAKCTFLKPPGIHECPACGFAPERQNKVTEIDARLVRLEQERKTRTQWYVELKRFAEMRHYSPNWAAVNFKEKFGAWPPRHWEPLPSKTPGPEVTEWVTAKNKAYAKSRRSVTRKTCRHCGGTNLQRTPGKGPHAAGLACGGCGRFVQWISKAQA